MLFITEISEAVIVKQFIGAFLPYLCTDIAEG